MFFFGLAWKNMKKWRFIESEGLCDHSGMFSWLRDIIFEGFKKFENFIFSESNFQSRFFHDYAEISSFGTPVQL